MKQSMQVLTSSESNEWYTPPKIIEIVHKVLGTVNLDPASSELANRVIKAETFWTEKGTKRHWFGKVFCNPPYGKRGAQGKFLRYALEQYSCGNVEELIVLTKAVPGYVWWDSMFHDEWEGLVCLTKDRLSFYKPEWVISGEINRPKNSKSKAASTFWYLGDNSHKFARAFSELGIVLDFEEGIIWE
jgi:hypothetical protein